MEEWLIHLSDVNYVLSHDYSFNNCIVAIALHSYFNGSRLFEGPEQALGYMGLWIVVEDTVSYGTLDQVYSDLQSTS